MQLHVSETAIENEMANKDSQPKNLSANLLPISNRAALNIEFDWFSFIT